jgi:hypothetical protein
MSVAKSSSEIAAGPNRRVLGECPPGWTPERATVDARIAEMRAHLARTRPTSDAEALKALRAAFPDVSLAVRVAAISARG